MSAPHRPDSPSYQVPFPDSGVSLGTDIRHIPENWISDSPVANDWSSLDEFCLYSPEPPVSSWPSWDAVESHALDTSKEAPLPLQQSDIHPASAEASVAASASMPFSLHTDAKINNFQWLDGAYHPPDPCSHCRRHRLQCLIIRTTAANPNPVTSCSSCVALFRECSLAKGEKRLPSGFETYTPVLGHLHGLPENVDDEGNQIFNSIEPSDKQKESKQFVRKGARVLREWFHQHQEFPYPDDDQKMRFSQETGFSQKRISTWFANARRRQKQKIQVANTTSTTRTRAGSPMVTSTLSSLTPMERWRASPPEDEPAAESAIQDALASSEMDFTGTPFEFDISSMDLFDFDQASSHLPSSASSFGSRASETSESISSAWSHNSGDENLPFPLLPKSSRSRRRRADVSSDGNVFQCTFCTRSFKKRHDWSRHEKSVHISFENWICTPDLNALQRNQAGLVTECCCCEAVFPDPTHWEEHEFHVCAAKPVTERSFSRKDYLWQHLRKFHGCTKTPISDLEAWRGTGALVESRCGFCDLHLSTWNERTDHLAGHFKDGMRMDQWVGDWGLNPSAMAILRHAILPNQRSLEV